MGKAKSISITVCPRRRMPRPPIHHHHRLVHHCTLSGLFVFATLEWLHPAFSTWWLLSCVLCNTHPQLDNRSTHHKMSSRHYSNNPNGSQ
jgi:hypothetical protein